MSTQNESAPARDRGVSNRYEGDTEKVSSVSPQPPVTQARLRAEADFAKIWRRPVEVVRLTQRRR